MRCTSKRSKNRTYKIITAFAHIHEIQKKKKKPHYPAPKVIMDKIMLPNLVLNNAKYHSKASVDI